MTLLERAIKIAIFFITIYVFWFVLKFDLLEKETIAMIVLLIFFIGLGDVIDNIVKTYKLIVYLIESK